MAAQAAGSQAKDSIAWLKSGSAAWWNVCHYCGAVAAGRTGVSWIHAQHVEHIPAEHGQMMGLCWQAGTNQKRRWQSVAW